MNQTTLNYHLSQKTLMYPSCLKNHSYQYFPMNQNFLMNLLTQMTLKFLMNLMYPHYLMTQKSQMNLNFLMYH
jgi:hypothetical protein